MSARTTAEKLRAAIEQSGITQHELARRSGVGQDGISRYVCGKREPSDETLFRLADALHIPAEALRGVRKKDGAPNVDAIPVDWLQSCIKIAELFGDERNAGLLTNLIDLWHRDGYGFFEKRTKEAEDNPCE